MRIDLHAHSSVSDGTDSPAALMRAAAWAGLDVVGLTDHDTAAGWDDAAAAAEEVGVGLMRGIEISTRHRGRGVHLLGYLADPNHAELAAMLARIVACRGDRTPAMLAALRRHGIRIEDADVLVEAGGVVGRPHVADALIRVGVVADRDAAFAQWLDPGRPGYVDRYAPALDDAVRVVVRAGGVPVLAHPWARGRRALLGADELGRLRDLGLVGVEVDHREHDGTLARSGGVDVRPELRAIARDLDLVVTGSSDHHGLGKHDHDLGCHTTEPAELERLLAAATSAVPRP